MNTISRISDFLFKIKFEDLPENVIHESKRILLDSIGCAVAGLNSKKGQCSVDVSRKLGGPQEASIIGTPYKVSAANAAFANGETINALDFDAILRPAVHITPWVIPSAIGLGESLHSSGKELLLAIALGHEISNKLAKALSTDIKLNDTIHKITYPQEKAPISGYSFNAISSAGIAGKIIGLEPDALANAIAIAGYNAPMQSFTQWEQSGTPALIKYGSAGWVAQTGVVAAMLAESGYTGDLTLLDGEYGFWRYSGAQSWNPTVLFDGLGEDWEILDVRYKKYPCCGITHSALDAFTNLIEENKLTPDDIERVTVWLDPTAQLPLWQQRKIDDEVKAQFSVAYDIAVAAFRLNLNWEWLKPATRINPAIINFMQKIEVLALPEYNTFTNQNSSVQMSIVEIKTHKNTIKKENRFASGKKSPGKPSFSDQYLEGKFINNTTGHISNSLIGEFIEQLWEKENQANIADLISLLSHN